MSFSAVTLKQSSFDYPYHFHPEYELTLILKGSGKRFAGNDIDDFQEGDLVLVGKNLPHCWLDYGKNSGEVKAIVVQFQEDCFGKQFFHLPELTSTRMLLEKAAIGIHFPGGEGNVRARLAALPGLSGFEKLTSLIGILNELSSSKTARTLSKIDYTLRSETTRFNRINVVYDFVYQNFRKEIRIGELASLVHMNISAFCHYFKKCTGKTVSEFINEIRIGYACKLLIETDLNVAQVCYESGYSGISNFNKVFKIIAHYSPLNYRKEFR